MRTDRDTNERCLSLTDIPSPSSLSLQPDVTYIALVVTAAGADDDDDDDGDDGFTQSYSIFM